MPRAPKIPKGAPRPRHSVMKMAPYSPPTAGRAGKLRLDFNENTVGCSPRVVESLRRQLSPERLAVYPEYVEARPILAKHFRMPEESFVLTNGTDEAIQLLINTYVEPGNEVVVLKPSYAMYRFYAEVAGAAVKEVPYTPGDLSFPMDALLAAISPNTRAVLLANPNNPTGTGIPHASIERILKRTRRAAVLIDEAYYEFSGVTAFGYIPENGNLFVSRTFSKIYGLAALRLGCLFSQPGNIAYVHKGQSPYSVNSMAVMAALEAIEDHAYIETYVTEVLAARELLCVGLEKLKIHYYPSQGNFLLFKAGKRAVQIRDKLREKGVLVRDRSYEIAGCVRVTVGTREQARKFLAALEEVL